MKTIGSSFQWMIFLLVSSIAAPVAIASLFQLEGAEAASFIQRTMLIVGLSGLLQGLFGHKLPINEGPAGLWWGVFTIYAGFAGVLYADQTATLQVLQSGMVYAGSLFIVLSAAGLLSKMKALFTPSITFVYLMLLVLQLSGTFLKGMMGITGSSGQVDLFVMGGSFAVLLFSFWVMNHTHPLLRQYSVLLAIAVGWLVFTLIGKAAIHKQDTTAWLQLPDVFVYGPFQWDSGMAVTAFFITFLLIANMLASIRVMEGTLEREFAEKVENRIRQSGWIAGVNHVLSGVFSAVGSVPISGAAGFVSTTRTRALMPFLIGCLLIVLMTFFPAAMRVLSSIPPAVAYTVTFVIFTGMVRMAFQELAGEPDQSRALRVAALGLMSGVGCMFLPPDSVAGLPTAAAAMLSNGLVTGTVIALCYEQWLIWREKRAFSGKTS